MQQIFTESDVSAAFGGPATYLGTGSFGETWRIGDQAIKIIHQTTQRESREVEGLRRCRHRNVVRLLETDTVTLHRVQHEVLRFEYVSGGDLAAALSQGRHLQMDEIADFLGGLLRGIQALHEAGVLHRDLKPANVAVRDGVWAEPVILDLGLVRLLDMASITVYPALLGTLPYMAPEQIEGRRVRKAADLFAAGVLTREAITGVHPFHPPGADLQDPARILARIAAGPTALPSQVPERIKVLLDRLVSPTEHRRGTPRSCLRDLEDVR